MVASCIRFRAISVLILTLQLALVASQLLDAETLKRDVQAFFNETYIKKVKSQFTKLQGYLAKGYKSSWDFFHIHHACFAGGDDGMFIGDTDLDNEWTKTVDKSISVSDWNRESGRLTMEALKLNVSKHGFKNFTIVKGPSMIINCHRQVSNLLYPSMWMSKLGFIFEFAQMHILNEGIDLNSLFNEALPESFKNLVMYQCADPVQNNWEWGKVVFAMTLAHAIESKIFHGGENATAISGYYFKERMDELVCYEDLYVSIRSHIWLQGPSDLITFRQKAAAISGEPAEALSKAEELPKATAPFARQNFCSTEMETADIKGFMNSTARIKIFQRVLGRQFLNIEEVKSLAQNYSTVPVEIVYASPNTSVPDLIKIFNSFDVLITPEGGHLTNGVFTMYPNKKGVIEISAVVNELNYYKNYALRLGFAGYVLSDGHLTPAPECPWHSADDFKDCVIDRHAVAGKIPQEYFKCKLRSKKDIDAFRMCNTQINIPKLQSSLDLLFNVLCSRNATAV